jgi:hypothetical protein
MMRYKRPDRKNAQSIVLAAERDMNYTMTLQVTQASAATIIRNIYECFRMLGDALLVMRGTVSQDHITQIHTLMALNVNARRPLGAIDNLRLLRHNINYNGYAPNLAEAKDAIDLAKACFKPLHAAVLKEIERE